jgi:nucleotide-binding universal stress UspA family protein
MAYRTILVDLADDDRLEPRLQVARGLAERFDAVLVGMHVMLPPYIPVAYGEAAAYVGDLIEAQRAANQEIRDRVQAVFRKLCGEAPKVLWQEAEGYRDDLLAEAAKTADLVLASRTGAKGSDVPDVLDQLVTAAGIPVLAVPADASADIGRTVLVGWNGAREATRAAHDALPFLLSAKRVILCAVGEGAATSLGAAVAMLQRHSVSVDSQQVDGQDANAGEVLLAQAAAQGADLLVMGAYGHSRLRELVFGGATRHVLREATLPVLFGS